jgi:hypothetical protein
MQFPSSLGETHRGLYQAALRSAHLAELVDQ